MKITNTEIKEQLAAGKKNLQWSSEEIGMVLILSMPEHIESIEFINCTFKELVQLADLNIGLQISFEECTFESNVRIGSLRRPNDELLSFEIIEFTGCIFKSTMRIRERNGSIQNGIVVEDCTINKGLYFEIKSCIGSVTLKDSKVGLLHILGSKVTEDIVLEGTAVLGNCFIKGVSCKRLEFSEKTVVDGRLDIDYCSLLEMEISECQFQQEVTLESVRIENEGLNIDDSGFSGQVSIVYKPDSMGGAVGPRSIHISSCAFDKELTIATDGGRIPTRRILDKLILDMTTSSKGSIYAIMLHIGVVQISGYNLSTNIMCENLKVTRIDLDGLVNPGSLILSAIKPSSDRVSNEEDSEELSPTIWSMKKVNLGKTQFHSIDFAAFERVDITHAIMADISGAMVSWFEPKQLNKHHKKHLTQYREILKKYKNYRIRLLAAIFYLVNDALDFSEYNNRVKRWRQIRSSAINRSRKQLRADAQNNQEVYRQLKYSAEKQGDRPQALEFQRWEMHYYRQFVRYGSRRNVPERLILLAGLTNNFGQSWWKATWVFILISFPLYVLFALHYAWPADWHSDIGFWNRRAQLAQIVFDDQIRYWLIGLNPAHSLRDLPSVDGKTPNWIYIWDFLNRIVSAFFLFQIVSAFRKLSK